jgi:hypothetical protein
VVERSVSTSRWHFVADNLNIHKSESLVRYVADLARKLLRRASFASINDLNAKVRAFVEYFNKTMAKPFKMDISGEGTYQIKLGLFKPGCTSDLWRRA